MMLPEAAFVRTIVAGGGMIPIAQPSRPSADGSFIIV
jgi:hypothetical protein